MHRYRGLVPIRYWKPIQTGIEQDDDTETVRQLGRCAAREVFADGVRLPRPVSPHLAAALSGQTIVVSSVVARARSEGETDRWIVEGAGGVLVPLNETELMIDLMAALGLPVLVVSRSTLGTINHTLLTIEALRARALTVAGVLMSGDPNRDNRAAIEAYGGVRVVGELPRLEPLTPAALERWAAAELDPDACLLEWLQ